jgi:hypothetical protein
MQSSNDPNPSNHNQISEVSYCLPVDAKTQKGIRLTLSVDPQVPDQAEEFEAVAATHPQSIQEFLIRLNELQKQKAHTYNNHR